MIERTYIILLLMLVSPRVVDAQFHSQSEKGTVSSIIRAEVASRSLLIDYLMRVENLSEKQHQFLTIAAKGTGERLAEKEVPNYGSEQTSTHEGNDLWNATIKQVLTPEQQAGLKAARTSRKWETKVLLIDRLDHTLLFDSDQREKIGALLKNSQRKSDKAAIHPAEIGGVDKAKVREILSVAQYEAWEAIMQGRFDFNRDPLKP